MGQSWREIPGGVTAPLGYRAAGTAAGLKPSGELDLALILSDVEAQVAGTFTQNVVKAACVTYGQEILAAGSPVRAIVCNAGQANACTGEEGDRDNLALAQLVAESVGVQATEVLTASTGVIGQRIDLAKVETAMPQLAAAAMSASGLTGWPSCGQSDPSPPI